METLLLCYGQAIVFWCFIGAGVQNNRSGRRRLVTETVIAEMFLEVPDPAANERDVIVRARNIEWFAIAAEPIGLVGPVLPLVIQTWPEAESEEGEPVVSIGLRRGIG